MTPDKYKRRAIILNDAIYRFTAIDTVKYRLLIMECEIMLEELYREGCRHASTAGENG